MIGDMIGQKGTCYVCKKEAVIAAIDFTEKGPQTRGECHYKMPTGKHYTKISKCRSCGWTKLTPVLDLGEQWVINMGDKEELKAPLELVFCPQCTLVQLRHTVDPEYLFREYYYKSGVNDQMKETLKDIVSSAMKRIGVCTDGEIVVDIGANDGTLLSYVNPASFARVAFEPAKNIPRVPGLDIEFSNWVKDFFSAEAYDRALVPPVPRAKLIFAISMFYDLDNPNAFLEDIKKVLAPDGLFVIQQNYLPRMLELNAFDNIVAEHLEYYSVWSLVKLVEKHGLKIIEVEFNDVNGGSFRTYIRHADHAPLIEHHSVSGAYEREREMGLDKLHTYKDFAAKVSVISKKIHDFVEREVGHGKTFYIAGASTRGNTLLQVCGLDSKLIKFAVERNPAKFGKKIGWAGIDIVSEKMADELPPDYYIVLPWHFLPEFFAREQKYLRRGGMILVPLPRPAVISEDEL